MMLPLVHLWHISRTLSEQTRKIDQGICTILTKRCRERTVGAQRYEIKVWDSACICPLIPPPLSSAPSSNHPRSLLPTSISPNTAFSSPFPYCFPGISSILFRFHSLSSPFYPISTFLRLLCPSLFLTCSVLLISPLPSKAVPHPWRRDHSVPASGSTATGRGDATPRDATVRCIRWRRVVEARTRITTRNFRARSGAFRDLARGNG